MIRVNGQQNILETDTLVIGAGPAGTSCAIQLLRAGWQVVLVDKFSFPRHAPGETLHPGIEPLLDSLGLKAQALKKGFLRHDGIINISEKGSIFTPYNEKEKWQGFQLFREDFDQLLVEEAVKLGAQFLTDCIPLSLSLDEDRNIREVVTSQKIVRPRYVIDATGRRAWLSSHLDINYKHYSPKLISYYGYVECKDEGDLRNPKIYWDQFGWTWIAKVKEELLSWVRLDIRECKKINRYWIPEQLSGYQASGVRRAVDVTWRIIEKTSDKNFFFIGDAAFVLDPASSHGVIKAIMSGMMAAHLITSSKKTDLDRLHNYYNNWMKEWFMKDKEELIKSYTTYSIVNEHEAERWSRKF